MINQKSIRRFDDLPFVSDLDNFKDGNQINYLIRAQDQTGRAIFFSHLQNVTLTGHDCYYPNVLCGLENNQLILPIHEKFMSLNRGTIYESTGMVFNSEFSKTLKQKQEEQRPLFYFIYNTSNYYHFIYDTLPYLWTYFWLKQRIPELGILMNFNNDQQTKHYQFVEESLALLNIQSNDIVIHNNQLNTIYQHLYISSSLTHGGYSEHSPCEEIFEIYEKMKQQAMKIINQNKFPTRVYISRRSWLHGDLSNIGTNYTNRRKLMNEDQLVDYLTNQKEVKEIFTETMTMAEKIVLFSQAELIIGAIGGGMCNLLFSPSTTQSIILVSPTFLEVNERFRFSMDHTRITYFQDCQLDRTEPDEIPKFVRVKVINSKSPYHHKVGEVQNYQGQGKYLVKLGDGTTTGWSEENNYQEVTFDQSELEPQDNGLNSPWKMDLIKFYQINI